MSNSKDQIRRRASQTPRGEWLPNRHGSNCYVGIRKERLDHGHDNWDMTDFRGTLSTRQAQPPPPPPPSPPTSLPQENRASCNWRHLQASSCPESRPCPQSSPFYSERFAERNFFFASCRYTRRSHPTQKHIWLQVICCAGPKQGGRAKLVAVFAWRARQSMDQCHCVEQLSRVMAAR